MMLVGELAGRELLLNWHPESGHLVLLLDGRVVVRTGGRSGNPRLVRGPAATEGFDLDQLSVMLDDLNALTLDLRTALASSSGGSKRAPTTPQSADLAHVGAMCFTCAQPMILPGPLTEPTTCPNCTVKRMDRDRLGIAFQLITIAGELSRCLPEAPGSASARDGGVVSDQIAGLRALADRVVDNVTSGRDSHE
jgi:hypothetical protein